MEATYEQLQHQANLNRARSTARVYNNSTATAKKKSQKNPLGNYVEPLTDWMFIPATMLAILEDILDLFGIGEIPGLSLISSSTTGFALTLAGSPDMASIKQEKGKLSKLSGAGLGPTGKILILVASAIIEMFAIPDETVTAIYLYYSVLKGRQAADQNK